MQQYRVHLCRIKYDTIEEFVEMTGFRACQGHGIYTDAQDDAILRELPLKVEELAQN